ncbi:MAG: aminoglycoside phosphotransferase family protein [Alphaproteobacteria bacterium]|nr:aminoglycoside phosphotransferase family protein [Alphaproteobacteria bacterium]
MVAETKADPEVLAALERMRLVAPGEKAHFLALEGGVSSDIIKVETAAHTFCVKRALAKLKVERDWHAPVSRNAAEIAWLRLAGSIVPGAVPDVLGEDGEAGLFAMTWLDPARHPVWKTQLRDGIVEPKTAELVATRLVAIHNATADRPDIARRFANDHIFRPIRLEPYLLATAERHPDLAERLHELAEVTSTTKRALVHGDVSPKNILIGPAGPIFLDAECAWYGDPAFDLAFCLNHLMLKCLWRPVHASAYLDCFRHLASTYLAGVDWEAKAVIEGRVAHLLPGLTLARVDGKSPVEYITEETAKERLRRTVRPLIAEPRPTLGDIAQVWAEEYAN